MSKEIIENLTASEMKCYVCLEVLESLVELRGVYRGDFQLYSKDLERLQKDVSYGIISVKAHHEKSQRYRHIDCDPFDRKTLKIKLEGTTPVILSKGQSKKVLDGTTKLEIELDPVCETFTVEDL